MLASKLFVFKSSLLLLVILTKYALFTVCRQRSTSIIAMNVESAGLEVETSFSIVINAAAATPLLCKTSTPAWRSLCIRTALCAWR